MKAARKAVVTQAQMRRAKRVVQKAPAGFGGFRLYTNGTVDVLTRVEGAAAEPATDLDLELEEFKLKNGYG